MAEQTNAPAKTEQAGDNTAQMNVQRVYLKDLSLELPNAPAVFLEQDAPSIEVQIDVSAEGVVEGVFESQVTATITARVKDKVAFLVEGKQAGIVQLSNIPDEHVASILNVTVPQMIYPYLRANMADIITRTGFPPIHLAEIDFAGLFQARLQAFQEQQQQEQAAGPTTSVQSA